MTAETFAGTLPAIARTQDHRYIYEGVTYPGVTSVLGVLDKSGPLMTWAARQTATAAIEMYKGDSLGSLILATGEDGAVKALSSRANWQRDEAAQLGTEVHRMADEIIHGREPLGTPLATRYAEQYAGWLQRSGWRLRLSEAAVVAPALDGVHEGYGGTFDLLAYDADGRTVLADIKTGKGVYREAILQLAAYGMAPLVSKLGSDIVWPMVVPDRYCIIHVTADGVREVELNIGAREWMAWLACLDLYRWTQSVKGKL